MKDNTILGIYHHHGIAANTTEAITKVDWRGIVIRPPTAKYFIGILNTGIYTLLQLARVPLNTSTLD
ncbi:hypothetical protein N7537_003786 [Penicillium hordei]|uniref:Uncharacterized protein n=1 Tax=Penicillium hordei TaxID=40994 RepID=A0AAD6H6J5_9EURO|nr:uncharacterized protein N7537_003786 [Penicillium hordei]KAJ5607167.1 hypothetical protein N7537_003786 [Penicillium hordei]